MNLEPQPSASPMRGASELDTSAQGRVPQATRTEKRLVQCPSLSGRLSPREREDWPEVTQAEAGQESGLVGDLVSLQDTSEADGGELGRATPAGAQPQGKTATPSLRAPRPAPNLQGNPSVLGDTPEWKEKQNRTFAGHPGGGGRQHGALHAGPQKLKPSGACRLGRLTQPLLSAPAVPEDLPESFTSLRSPHQLRGWALAGAQSRALRLHGLLRK